MKAESDKIWKLYLESNNIIIKDLIIPEVVDQMVNIEQLNYSYEYAQPKSDLLDDYTQPKYAGNGLFVDNTLVGYIYGYYQCISDLVDIDVIKDLPIDNFTIYDKKYFKQPITIKTIGKGLKHNFNNKKTFYISNMVIDRKYRSKLFVFVLNFLKKIQKRKHKFISFDGLTDTQRLILNNTNGNINTRLLNRMGVSPIISYFNRNTPEYMAIFKLNESRI